MKVSGFTIQEVERELQSLARNTQHDIAQIEELCRYGCASTFDCDELDDLREKMQVYGVLFDCLHNEFVLKEGENDA